MPRLFSWFLIIFFDRNNLFEQFDRIKDLNKLKDQKEYYTKEIDSTNLKIKELRANPKLLEKHAREQLFMHKDSEDVFILNKTVKSSDE